MTSLSQKSLKNDVLGPSSRTEQFLLNPVFGKFKKEPNVNSPVGGQICLFSFSLWWLFYSSVLLVTSLRSVKRPRECKEQYGGRLFSSCTQAGPCAQHGCKSYQPETAVGQAVHCPPGLCPGPFCLEAFPRHPKPRRRITTPPFMVRGNSRWATGRKGNSGVKMTVPGYRTKETADLLTKVRRPQRICILRSCSSAQNEHEGNQI